MRGGPQPADAGSFSSAQLAGSHVDGDLLGARGDKDYQYLMDDLYLYMTPLEVGSRVAGAVGPNEFPFPSHVQSARSAAANRPHISSSHQQDCCRLGRT